jgi:Acyl-CoA synthetases (AMP-forming)/AMP-acid ligases II
LDEFVELASFLPRVAAKVPHKAAMVWRGAVTTYAELDSETSKLASSLEAAGFVRGERIGALMENSLEMVGVWLATLRAGCVFVPFNTALRGEMLGYQLHNSGVRLLFVDSSLLGNLEGVPLEGVRVIVNKVGEGLIGFGVDGDSTHVPVRVERSDPAVVLYTSGTTGSPKGVVLPHYAFINRVMEIERIVHLRGDDVLFNSLPLYHTSEQVMMTLPALLNGLTVVQQERFHASTFWSLAASSGATVSQGITGSATRSPC